MVVKRIEEKLTERCTGHCCRKFYLPYATKLDLADVVSHGRVTDGDFILDMVVKLPPQDEAGDGTPYAPDDPNRDHWWTCKHLDTKTGNCTVYDKRPEMCSAYPYGGPCLMKGCTASCEKSKWHAEHGKKLQSVEDASKQAATNYVRSKSPEDLNKLIEEAEKEYAKLVQEKP